MTTCIVTCSECKGGKRWEWLCEECAEDCQTTHRKQTGHQPELTVTVEIPTLSKLIRMAERVTEVRRW